MYHHSSRQCCPAAKHRQRVRYMADIVNLLNELGVFLFIFSIFRCPCVLSISHRRRQTYIHTNILSHNIAWFVTNKIRYSVWKLAHIRMEFQWQYTHLYYLDCCRLECTKGELIHTGSILAVSISEKGDDDICGWKGFTRFRCMNNAGHMVTNNLLVTWKSLRAEYWKDVSMGWNPKTKHFLNKRIESRYVYCHWNSFDKVHQKLLELQTRKNPWKP